MKIHCTMCYGYDQEYDGPTGLNKGTQSPLKDAKKGLILEERGFPSGSRALVVKSS